MNDFFQSHQRFLYTFGAVVFGGSILFYFIEKEFQDELTFEDSLWWSLMTATTVGAPDIVPKTWAGRWLIATPMTLASVAFLANLFSKITKHHINQAIQTNQLSAPP